MPYDSLRLPDLWRIIDAPDDRAGAKTDCPRCKQRVEVPRPAPEAVNQTVLGQLLPAPAAAPMPVSAVLCPRCTKPVVFDPRLAGQTVLCPHCQNPLQFGGAAAAPAPSLPILEAVTPARRNPRDKFDRLEEVRELVGRQRPGRANRFDDDSREDYYPRRRPAQRDGAAQGLGVAGFVCGVLALVFSFMPCLWIVAVPLGIVGLVLSAVSCSRSGLGVAGLIMSIGAGHRAAVVRAHNRRLVAPLPVVRRPPTKRYGRRGKLIHFVLGRSARLPPPNPYLKRITSDENEYDIEPPNSAFRADAANTRRSDGPAGVADPHRKPFKEYRRQIRKHYDGVAGALTAVTGFVTGHEALAGKLIRPGAFDIRGCKHILDAGCGNGRYSLCCATPTPTPYSPASTCRAKCWRGAARLRSARVTQVVADLTRLPYADATFDAVVCGWVLEHLPDPTPGLRKLARVIQPGGKLLLLCTEDTFTGAWCSRLWHCRTYNRKYLPRSVLTMACVEGRVVVLRLPPLAEAGRHHRGTSQAAGVTKPRPGFRRLHPGLVLEGLGMYPGGVFGTRGGGHRNPGLLFLVLRERRLHLVADTQDAVALGDDEHVILEGDDRVALLDAAHLDALAVVQPAQLDELQPTAGRHSPGISDDEDADLVAAARTSAVVGIVITFWRSSRNSSASPYMPGLRWPALLSSSTSARMVRVTGSRALLRP